MNIAKPSPRIEKDGSLRWYEGNTFKLTFELTLLDSAGQTIPFLQTDEIVVNFVTSPPEQATLVHSFWFNNLKTNQITMNFSKAITKNFIAGEYEIGITKNGAFTQTIIPYSKVVVERTV